MGFWDFVCVVIVVFFIFSIAAYQEDVPDETNMIDAVPMEGDDIADTPGKRIIGRMSDSRRYYICENGVKYFVFKETTPVLVYNIRGGLEPC